MKLNPTESTERISSLDVIRGVALLGILVMNIKTFAMIGAAYFIPTSFGDLKGANLWVWWGGDLLANRKFMTIFSALFGAGVVLQAARAEAKRLSFRGFFYRRLFWLWIMGLIHAYVFWDGDILVTYALCGVFLYPLRNVRPSRLLWAGLLILAVGSALSLAGGLSAPYWDEVQLQEFQEELKPGPEAIEKELAALKGSWLDEIRYRYPKVWEMHLMVIPWYLFWRGLGVMMLGMALFKWGHLQGHHPRVSRIWIWAAVLVGLPVTAYGALRQFASGWDPIPAFMIDTQFGYWGSLPIALGWIGLVHLALEKGWFVGLQNRLGAVGQTALSNYLLQTLLCTFIFYGRGLGLYGSVSRVEQMGVVLGVWMIQLWLSPWWLAKYRYGPVEWLWRSLSYWKRQPLTRVRLARRDSNHPQEFHHE